MISILTFIRLPLLLAGVLAVFPLPLSAFEIPGNCGQLIVGTARDWDASEAVVQRWERTATGWKPVGTAIQARLGASGLAWGIGLHPGSALGPQKKEGDGRAPAGVFKIGNAYGYAPSILKHPELIYQQVSERDLWVEDPSSEYYNRHLRLASREPVTEWERQAQMRMNDPAHSLKLFIGHNPPPNAVPYAGSAIFFHIWRRDGEAPTSGCTVMQENDLRSLIAWVNPDQNPLYVLLPSEVYATVRESWRLP
jgi:L,D-peptidoglycan transpeptidase YkuD (ErfK/YbiS/YcfS/YnhG family)